MTRFVQEIINWRMSNEGKQLLPCERIKFIQSGEEKAQRGFVVALKYLIRGCERARGTSQRLRAKGLQVTVMRHNTGNCR